MLEQPQETIDLYEDDYIVVTDDPDEEMINIAFVERSLVMRFDYAEFLEFAPIVERIREHVRRRVRRESETGR